MTVQYRITRILSTLLLAGLCSAPLLRAQQTNPATPQQAPETSQQPQQPTTTQPAPSQPGTTQPATTPAPAAANDDTARAGFSHATGYYAAWYYANNSCAACRPGAEHAACGSGKPESAAADCAVRDNGESVASAAESGDDVS